MRARTPVALLATALLLTGCTGDDASVEAEPVSSTSEEASSSDGAAYAAAIQRTADASQRSFTSLVRVGTPNGTIEVRLEGTVSGDDRTLTVITDQGSVTYEVVDGAATVDRGDGARAIDLSEVPAAPSLTALGDLQDLRFPMPGQAVGTIDASAVLGEGTPAAPVEVTVRFEADGFVRAFQMNASDGSFSATVSFEDVAA